MKDPFEKIGNIEDDRSFFGFRRVDVVNILRRQGKLKEGEIDAHANQIMGLFSELKTVMRKSRSVETNVREALKNPELLRLLPILELRKNTSDAYNVRHAVAFLKLMQKDRQKSIFGIKVIAGTVVAMILIALGSSQFDSCGGCTFDERPPASSVRK